MEGQGDAWTVPTARSERNEPFVTCLYTYTSRMSLGSGYTYSVKCVKSGGCTGWLRCEVGRRR